MTVKRHLCLPMAEIRRNLHQVPCQCPGIECVREFPSILHFSNYPTTTVCGTAFVCIPRDQWDGVPGIAEQIVEDVRAQIFK